MSRNNVGHRFMMAPCLAVAILLAASSAQAAANIDSTFVNLDFDSSTQPYFPLGFDAAAYNIPGWQNATTITDAGIEFEGVGWWGPYEDYSAFLKTGEGAFNLSSYVIQSGNQFQVSAFAKRWNANDLPEMVVTLFYGADPSMNAIGSFNTGALTGTWTSYGSTIPATAASVGQTLGVRVVGAGTWFTNFDELSINVIPEPASVGLAGIALVGLLSAARRRVR